MSTASVSAGATNRVVTSPTDLAYFDGLYKRHGDPWAVASRWYEQRKRDVLLATLPRQRYRNAFEPACGIGELSAQLATRCERLLASDFSPAAQAATRSRVQAHAHVSVGAHDLTVEWPQPDEPFDLVVLSECLYYLPPETCADVQRRLLASLADDGHLVACHWRPDFKERQQSTEAIHADLGRGLRRLARHEDTEFLLEVWSREDCTGPVDQPPSEAQSGADS